MLLAEHKMWFKKYSFECFYIFRMTCFFWFNISVGHLQWNPTCWWGEWSCPHKNILHFRSLNFSWSPCPVSNIELKNHLLPILWEAAGWAVGHSQIRHTFPLWWMEVYIIKYEGGHKIFKAERFLARDIRKWCIGTPDQRNCGWLPDCQWVTDIKSRQKVW